MTEPTAPFRFHLNIAPAWEGLLPRIAARAQSLGIAWPSDLKPARFPRIYAAILDGKSVPMHFSVIAWEPPKERVVQPDVAKIDDIHVSFGVAAKRTFATANPKGCDTSALGVHLDGSGLCLPATANQPLERLAEIPMGQVLRSFAAVAQGDLQLERTGVDHIVDKFGPPTGLEAFSVSRWRGDPSYRITGKLARLEVTITMEG